MPISARPFGNTAPDWVVRQGCRNTCLDGSAGQSISKDLISSLEGGNFPSSLCSLLVTLISLSFSLAHFTSKMAKLGIVEIVPTTTLSTSIVHGCQRVKHWLSLWKIQRTLTGPILWESERYFSLFSFPVVQFLYNSPNLYFFVAYSSCH